MLRNFIGNTWLAGRLKLCVCMCVHPHTLCILYVYISTFVYVSVNIYDLKNQNRRSRKSKDLNPTKNSEGSVEPLMLGELEVWGRFIEAYMGKVSPSALLAH